MLPNISSSGSGGLPPLALVHGWGGSYDATYGDCGWRQVAASSGRSLIEVDLPGHGTAPASRDPAAYGDLATGLAARLPNCLLDTVGFSMGGKLLLELAIRHPSSFRRIVIGGVGDNIFAPEAAGVALATALENGAPLETPKAIAALITYSQLSKSDPFAIAAVLRRTANPLITRDRLRQITAELLIVNGDDDNIAQPDAGFCAALPQARCVHLAGTDHFGLPGSPRFQEICFEFLNAS